MGEQKANRNKPRRRRPTLEQGSKVHLQPLLSTTLTWDNSVLASRQGHSGTSPLASMGNAGENIGNFAEIQRSSLTGMSHTSVPGPGFVTPQASAIVVGGVSVPAGFNIGEVSSAKPTVLVGSVALD